MKKHIIISMLLLSQLNTYAMNGKVMDFEEKGISYGYKPGQNYSYSTAQIFSTPTPLEFKTASFYDSKQTPRQNPRQNLKPNKIYPNGETGLHRACRNLDLNPKELVNLIYQTDRETINKQTHQEQETPLHKYLYCNKPDLRVVQALIINGEANLNLKSNSGKTPIMHLIEREDIDSETKQEFAKLLVQNGADLFIRDRRGNSAIAIAKKEDINLYYSLLTHLKNPQLTSFNSTFHDYIKHENILDIDILNIFIDNIHDINTRDAQGNTAIKLLMERHDVDIETKMTIVHILIKNGANPYIKNINEENIFNVIDAMFPENDLENDPEKNSKKNHCLKSAIEDQFESHLNKKKLYFLEKKDRHFGKKPASRRPAGKRDVMGNHRKKRFEKDSQYRELLNRKKRGGAQTEDITGKKRKRDEEQDPRKRRKRK